MYNFMYNLAIIKFYNLKFSFIVGLKQALPIYVGTAYKKSITDTKNVKCKTGFEISPEHDAKTALH